MIDVTTVLAGVLPFAVLGLASLRKPFRVVLKSVFTDGNKTSTIEWLPDGDVRLTPQAASLRQRADVIVGRRSGKTVQRSQLAYASREKIAYSRIAAAIGDATLDNKEVIITILDGGKKVDVRTDPSHAGRHSRGDLVAGSAE